MTIIICECGFEGREDDVMILKDASGAYLACPLCGLPFKRARGFIDINNGD